MTPKASFSSREGKLLGILLWATMALFLGIMAFTWIAAEKAHPVLLDLKSGQPVERRPAL